VYSDKPIKEVSMFSRIRIAAGLALLLVLVTSITVFAKGGFSFIVITGPGLKEEVRATDSSLTEDFFAFADFYRDKIEAPANPGQGYEITRYYVDGKREIAFDQLHYYPETGYVFYDGIVNGKSEYDGEWYTANPAVKKVFESVLPAASIAKAPSVKQPESAQPVVPVTQAQPVPSIDPSQVAVPVVILAGLLILALFAFRSRRPSIR
jgi:hypothetical protein